MTNKFSIADSVAADMNSLITSEEYRSLFARPQIKVASACKLHPKDCGCKNCPKECDCDDCKDGVDGKDGKDEKKEAHLESALDDLIRISGTLDEAGFEKSAALALAAAEFLISEARKKKTEKKDEKKGKKEDKKDEKKGKKPFPFAKKKDKKDEDDTEEDDKKGKKGKKPFPFAKKQPEEKKKLAQLEPNELLEARCENCDGPVELGETFCEECAEHEATLTSLFDEPEAVSERDCPYCGGTGCDVEGLSSEETESLTEEERASLPICTECKGTGCWEDAPDEGENLEIGEEGAVELGAEDEEGEEKKD